MDGLSLAGASAPDRISLSSHLSLESVTSDDFCDIPDIPTDASFTSTTFEMAERTITPVMCSFKEDVIQVVEKSLEELQKELTEELDKLQAEFRTFLLRREKSRQAEEQSVKGMLQRLKNQTTLWLRYWILTLHGSMGAKETDENDCGKMLMAMRLELQTMLTDVETNHNSHVRKRQVRKSDIDGSDLGLFSRKVEEIAVACQRQVDMTMKRLKESVSQLEACQTEMARTSVDAFATFGPTYKHNRPPPRLPPITGLSEKAKQLLTLGEIPDPNLKTLRGRRKKKGKDRFLTSN